MTTIRLPYRASVAFLSSFTVIAVGYLLLQLGYRSPLSWLPTGIATAILLRWDKSLWPWLGCGALLAGALLLHSPLAIASGALAVVLGPLLLAGYLQSRGFLRDFSRRADVLRFVFATPVAMLLPPTVTMLTLQYGGAEPRYADPLPVWLAWWFSATTSVMLLAPPIVAATRGMPRAWYARRYEALALLAATALFVLTTIGAPLGVRLSYLLPFGTLLVVISAMRMDLTFTGLLSLAMASGIAVSMGLVGVGTGQPPGPAGMIRVWSFVMLLAGISLTLRALLAEREAADQRLREAETRYRQGLLEAAALEQERIGRDLHDSLGQELTALSLLARAHASQVRAANPELAADAETLVQLCGQAAQSARRVARGLTPPIEDGADLVRALRNLAGSLPESAGVEVRIAAAATLPVPAGTARHLYRIAQEALNNALKHAQARHIRITIADDGPRQLRLTVADDGIGMARALADSTEPGGLGLRTMRYRAEVAGGRIHFESQPGRGTRVRCEVPVPERTAASLAGEAAVRDAMPEPVLRPVLPQVQPAVARRAG